jgi:hypothetical protein
MHVPRSAVAGSRRPMFVAKRRRRLRPVLLALGLVGAVALYGAAGDRGTAPAGGPDAADAAPQSPVAEAPDVDPRGSEAPTPPLATFDGLTLHLPTERPIIVGFHEASTPAALEMGPSGRLQENENTTKFEPPDEVEDGSDYLVMASRGRPRAATSAVDVVMHTGDPVLSPVSGTVTDVRTYHLYGAHEDYRIELAPHDAPDLRIVLIHLDDLEIAEGDEVQAGESVLAGTARPFPFSSQIDRYTEPKRWPHVHLEVKVADDEDDADEDADERRSATG